MNNAPEIKSEDFMNFPFKYQVRFTSISDGNDFATEHKAYIYWINDTDELNRANIHCKYNIYNALKYDERVQQFNWLKAK